MNWNGQTVLGLRSKAFHLNTPLKKWAMKELTKLGKPTSLLRSVTLIRFTTLSPKLFSQNVKKALENQLPETLFLGCRTHRGPNIFGKGSHGFGGCFFSVNVYDSRVRSWQVPADLDLPILASEFHLGRWIVVSQARDFRAHGIKGKEPRPLLTTFLLL